MFFSQRRRPQPPGEGEERAELRDPPAQGKVSIFHRDFVRRWGVNESPLRQRKRGGEGDLPPRCFSGPLNPTVVPPEPADNMSAGAMRHLLVTGRGVIICVRGRAVGHWL